MSYGRGVRVLAAWLEDNAYILDEKRAHRVAARVLGAALPTNQRAPRKRPAALSEAA